MTATVLFLTRQRLLGETFAAAFNYLPEVEFLPPVSTTEEAVESILMRRPDMTLVDVNSCLFGLRVIKEIQSSCPECPIFILASHTDPVTTNQFVGAGVKGVLSTAMRMTDLIFAIQQAVAGETKAARSYGGPATNNGPVSQCSNRLTDRELQVLEFVAQGLANKQIAAELGISIKTVEKHRQNLMCKLQTHETAGLTWRAVCMGVARATL